MSLSKEKRTEIIDFIINNLEKNPENIVSLTASKYHISRQSISKYMQELKAKDLITSSGNKRNMLYVLKKTSNSFTIKLDPSANEHDIWVNHIKPLLPELKENVNNICYYVVTEMINNAIDHSSSTDLFIQVENDAKKISFEILDHGIGIFNKIQQDFNLEDPKYALLELAKGKLTSDPAKHTGEGIFFSSRMVDLFSIYSGNLFFSHDISSPKDMLLDAKTSTQGTLVSLTIRKDSKLLMKQVFDKFTTSSEDGISGFSRTVIPLELMQMEGENLISRSQAKRLIVRFERFQEVILNFKGIKFLGQPFADELFRVFKHDHPDVNLITINENADVKAMIAHVQNNI